MITVIEHEIEEITLTAIEELKVIYNLGNFKNGKVVTTNNKSTLEKYIKMGYTLISTIWK